MIEASEEVLHWGFIVLISIGLEVGLSYFSITVPKYWKEKQTHKKLFQYQSGEFEDVWINKYITSLFQQDLNKIFSKSWTRNLPKPFCVFQR